ncbi:MAG: NAD(P)-dependent oxidoreductase [Candidatus Mariimomonas ferrooxydans]
MNILVTGGTGFIGSHLADRLIKNGHNVTVPVRSKSSLEFIDTDNVELKSSNLLDYPDVCSLMKGIDAVFHLASVRGSGWEYTDEQIWDTNMKVTENLLKASVGALKHFIYMSSVSVYGHFKGGPLDENYPFSPLTRYGRTKYESERLVEKYQKEKGLNTTIIRPVITYGARDTWGMVTKLAVLINSNRYLAVGSGDNRVHLIYIDDLVNGLTLAVNNESVFGEALILAGEKPVTINSLVGIVETALKKRVPGIHVPLWFAIPAAYLMEASYRIFLNGKEPFITRYKIDIMSRDRCFSMNKANSYLGFKPDIDYTEGVSRTVDWLKIYKLV